MIHILYRGSTSACFEIGGTSPYRASESYTVSVDGEERLSADTNVFSLYGLKPDTAYRIEARFASGRTEDLELHTAGETCALSVRDFGAVGDGVHDDTPSLQAAINAVPDGGRLIFPAGTYLSLPLSLRSHITIELCAGAVLLGSPERERYPILTGLAVDPVTGQEVPLAAFEGLERPAYQSLLQGAFCEDVSIVGPGTVDGNGQNGDWWRDFNNFPAARPRVVFLNRCKNVTLHGVTVKNGPSWNLHPFFSKDVSVLDCFVTAPKESPNTDGCDPESCDTVNIIGCRFSVGDDCIAIKSGKLEMAVKYKAPADRYTIRNCLMEFGHGAVTLGSEASAGVTNLTVTQCLFHATDRGLRIKSRRGRGKDSVITNVLFDNIKMDRVLTPIVINLWYNCCDPDCHDEYVWSREKLPVDDRTPQMGSFTFRNMDCTDSEVAACYIDGLTEKPIESVTLENIHISFAPDAKPDRPAMQEYAQPRCRLGLYLDNVKKVRLKNVSLEGVDGEKLITGSCESVETEGFDLNAV